MKPLFAYVTGETGRGQGLGCYNILKRRPRRRPRFWSKCQSCRVLQSKIRSYRIYYIYSQTLSRKELVTRTDKVRTDLCQVSQHFGLRILVTYQSLERVQSIRRKRIKREGFLQRFQNNPVSGETLRILSVPRRGTLFIFYFCIRTYVCLWVSGVREW